METTTITSLINNRVRKGFDAPTSTVILNQLLHSHTGDNLVHALVFNKFASEALATKIVKAIN